MADTQRTEKPTKRRLEKARREGKFPASKELIGGVQFLTFVALLCYWSPALLERLRALIRILLQVAFRPALTIRNIDGYYREALRSVFAPMLIAGAAVSCAAFAAQLAATRLGFSLQRLQPDISRLNPIPKLRDLPGQNMVSSAQALLLFPVIGFGVYAIARENLESYLSLPSLGVLPALTRVSRSYMSLLWRAAFGFVLLGCLDMLRQQHRYTKSLRMSKQEVRDELKETEGDPLIKSRVRRIQRDLARRNMLKNVPQATAVIVNPTHYSVAIRYEVEGMAAPRVLAKGKNYIARRIREIAIECQIPIVENQPLAQALYKSTNVGDEIPAHLYRAVAEVLAYIFKLMQRSKA